jgi:hypothetical protein
MDEVGEKIEHIFDSKPFQLGVQVAESVIGIAVPALGPLFNLTAQAVLTAEANFAAIGKSEGTGAQKLAAVVTNAGNLIEQGLKDAGVSNVTQQTIENYISAVVTILNATPASVSTPAPAGLPAPAAS